MNQPHTSKCQQGAVLSMEYIMLMTTGAISAMGIGVISASLLPETWYTWLSTAIDQAELAFQDLNNGFCASANAASAPPPISTSSCSGPISTATWYDGMGTPTP